MSEYKLGQKLYVFHYNRIRIGTIISIIKYFPIHVDDFSTDKIMTEATVRVGTQDHSLNAKNIFYGETIEEVLNKIKDTVDKNIEEPE